MQPATADGEAQNETAAGDEPVEAPATGDAEAHAQSACNVVTMVPSRLSDRIASLPGAKDRKGKKDGADAAPVALSESKTAAAVRALLSAPLDDGHVLILGAPDLQRTAAVAAMAELCARDLPPPDAHVFLPAIAAHRTRFKAAALPQPEAGRFAAALGDAVDAAKGVFDTLKTGDEHRLQLDLINEEHRHGFDAALEALRDRAEAQNIACVKTLDGYVLAPVHDGRAVRPDVFRALPESLQRDVEAKIAALESDLQELLATAPAADRAVYERSLALFRQTARRAASACFAPLKTGFAEHPKFLELIAVVEQAFEDQAVKDRHRVFALLPVTVGDAPSHAPVVFARSLTPQAIAGRIGYTPGGELALAPGHLMRANGGYLIIDAWRLAADPTGYAQLSEALETKCIRPLCGDGVFEDFDALPLSVRVVLMSDPSSFAKLQSIDPDAGRHFPAVVRFEGSDSAA